MKCRHLRRLRNSLFGASFSCFLVASALYGSSALYGQDGYKAFLSGATSTISSIHVPETSIASAAEDVRYGNARPLLRRKKLSRWIGPSPLAYKLVWLKTSKGPVVLMKVRSRSKFTRPRYAPWVYDLPEYDRADFLRLRWKGIFPWTLKSKIVSIKLGKWKVGRTIAYAERITGYKDKTKCQITGGSRYGPKGQRPGCAATSVQNSKWNSWRGKVIYIAGIGFLHLCDRGGAWFDIDVYTPAGDNAFQTRGGYVHTAYRQKIKTYTKYYLAELP